jgi:hypothetical protein
LQNEREIAGKGELPLLRKKEITTEFRVAGGHGGGSARKNYYYYGFYPISIHLSSITAVDSVIKHK